MLFSFAKKVVTGGNCSFFFAKKVVRGANLIVIILARKVDLVTKEWSGPLDGTANCLNKTALGKRILITNPLYILLTRNILGKNDWDLVEVSYGPDLGIPIRELVALHPPQGLSGNEGS